LPTDIRFWLRATLAAGAIVWALALPAAALAASRGEPHTTPGPTFAVAVYTLGGIICHQRPERTFHIGSIPLPVCARCTGIYAGAAIAGLIAFVLTRSAQSHHPNTSRLVLALAALPALTTLIFEWLSGQVPSNEVRALSGIMLGAGAAWVVLRLE
jgi:uncharacterized membrane protein